MPAIYKVAVIGTSFAEKVQIPAFQRHPRFKVVAVAGRNPEHTRRVAEKYDIDRWTVDWRELMEKKGIDVVSIVTPPYLHSEISLAASDAGIHVLCEKPMALNSEEARRMFGGAREKRLTAMIDCEFRHLETHRRFRDLIQDGYIGQLRRMIFSFHQDWHADPNRPWTWWYEMEKGGGFLNGGSPHFFDLTQFWFGRPKRVWGKLNTFVKERPGPDGQGRRAVTADDAFFAVLDLGDGREVIFDCNVTADPPLGKRMAALGSKGVLILEGNQRLLGAKAGEELQIICLSDQGQGEDPRISPFMGLLDDLATGIDEGGSLSPNFEDGLAQQRFIDAVKLSHSLGAWVDLPSENWE